jgi:nucleotide-binding universal stress UspA family protein
MRFMVAVDGSPESERALAYALDLGAELTARPAVVVAHAVDPDVYLESGFEPIADLADAEDRLIVESVENAEDRGAAILEDAAAIAEDRGVDVATELCYGDPVEAIPDLAATEGVDGIFLGHRSQSERATRYLGSVARGVLERATVPVTVVR